VIRTQLHSTGPGQAGGKGSGRRLNLVVTKKQQNRTEITKILARVGNGCALAAQEEAAKTKAKSHFDILADATERIGRARKDTRADTDTFHNSDFSAVRYISFIYPAGPSGHCYVRGVCSVVFVFRPNSFGGVRDASGGIEKSRSPPRPHARPPPTATPLLHPGAMSARMPSRKSNCRTEQ